MQVNVSRKCKPLSRNTFILCIELLTAPGTKKLE